jgi:hypothetical protein
MSLGRHIAIFVLGLFIAGCSGDEEEKKDHVFKEKTRTIDKAREVEGILKDAAEKQKKAAEDSGN